MTRKEHLDFCSTCTHRAFDPKLGVICGLTNAHADFDPTCPTYQEDTEVVKSELGISLSLGGETRGSIRVDKETFKRLKAEQDLNFAIIAGLLASILAATIWAAITVKTGYQIGYMAIGLGAAVGLSVRYAGKGMDPIYSFIGAGLALFGCVLGNFLSILGYASTEFDSTWIGVLNYVSIGDVLAVMVDSFEAVDFLFYGIAIYEGYRFAPRTFEVPPPGETIS